MEGRDQRRPQKKDVIRVKAKKYDNSTSTAETKTFSVDPELTCFSTLRELLIKAFNIKEDFIISYLVSVSRWTDGHYLPMLSEWDFNTAIYAASDPCLLLKIDMRPIESLADLNEWNIIDDEEVTRPTRTPTSPFITVDMDASEDQQQQRLIRNKPSRRSWFFDRNEGGESEKEKDTRQQADQNDSAKRKMKKHKPDSPMSESEYKSYLDAEGRLLDSTLFREAVYRGGLDPKVRRHVWPHLLNVYPKGLTSEERSTYAKRLVEKYECLKESWQRRLKRGYIDEELRLVANSVRKDVIRTDRTHPCFAGDEDENGNLMSLFNILTTYALAHPEVSYCQGMSDLASPLLTVMKEEGLTYLCFCALMRRMRDNFSCDGWAMTRKFHHLSELIQYYDPTFYEYLREMHSEDLLFAYRWLLLELKRECAFDDALTLMEVIWASLPSSPLAVESGCELDLYDIDLTAICGGDDDEHSPAPSCQTLHDWTASTTTKAEKGDKLGNGVDEQSGNGKELEYATGGSSINNVAVVVSSSMARFIPIKCVRASVAHSCPGIFSCSGGVCPALVVRSLMLDRKENKRLHELRHASYPTRPFARFTFDDGSYVQTVAARRRVHSTRCTIGCWSDELAWDVPADQEGGSNLEPILDDVLCSGSTSEGESDDVEQEEQKNQERIEVSSNECKEQRSSEDSTTTEEKCSEKKISRSYALRPSPEMKVSDSSDDSSVENVTVVGQPVPMAAEAYLDFERNNSDVDPLQNELTLTRIHEICLANVPLDDSAVASAKSSACVSRRSREPSGGNVNLQQQNVGTASMAFTATDVSQFPTRCSSISNGAMTNADSGIFEIAANNAVATKPMDVPTGGPSTITTTTTTTTVTNNGPAIDVNEFVNVDRDPTVSLPPPHELGDGNPFMLFICLTLILQHRDSIMKMNLDFNEIAVYFDKLMRRHDVKKVLKRARVLYADYLRVSSRLENEYGIGVSKAVAVSNSKYVER